MRIFGITRCGIAAGILALCVTFFGCAKKVTNSGAGSLSQGTFHYLQYVFFSDEKNVEDIPERLLEDDAKGILAEKLGLRSHDQFEKYKVLVRRARYNKAAARFWQEKFGKTITVDEAFGYYNIVFDPEKAVSSIKQGIFRKGNSINIGDDSIAVASWPNGEISLAAIREQLLPREWEQLLSFQAKPMAALLKESLFYRVCGELNKELVESFKAHTGELERVDYNHVADKYLQVKYGMADEGIYPTSKQRIKLLPRELFNHFQKIKNRLLAVTSVTAGYTVVADPGTAEKFLDEQKKGTSFTDLAEKYAVAAAFKKTARDHRIQGYDLKLSLDERENRSFIHKVILDCALRDLYNPEPFSFRHGIILIKIRKITREKREIKYTDYISEVKQDLNNVLLQKQFSIDVEDMVKEIDGEIFLSNI
ncbi:MAG: hypothetical protein GY754_31100 [bacterium]|nr:hypothetical protein [bacterium]